MYTSRKRARWAWLEGMPWAAASSVRIHESVRPAIGMPRKASRTPRSSSNARVMARAPAPPVSTSVPSISKRIREPRGASIAGSAFGANVAGARSLGRGLFVEVDALAFIQLIEAALHRAAVKEPLLPAVVSNEAEAAIPYESLDGATRHPSLLEHARAQSVVIKFRSTEIFDECDDFRTRRQSPAVAASKRIRPCTKRKDEGLRKSWSLERR